VVRKEASLTGQVSVGLDHFGFNLPIGSSLVIR
jgi:hypothetical protein